MRIGDLATSAGVSTKTVRFYEQAGLIPSPPRTPGGYRDYPEQAAKRLTFIRDAQSAGLTLAQIRSVMAIRDSGEAPCRHVAALIDQHLEEIEQRLHELRAARAALRSLADRASETDPVTCTEDDICTILTGR